MEDSCTPPDILKGAQNALAESLPKNAKSQKKYEKAYQDYKDYLNQKKMDHSSENSLLSYFYFLANEKKLAYSTLMSTFSMVKASLTKKENLKEEIFAKTFQYIDSFKSTYVPKLFKLIIQFILKFEKKKSNQKYLKGMI
jgi:hypothetical protein